MKFAQVNDYEGAKNSINEFAKLLDRHLMLESIRFYKYVEYELRDDPVSAKTINSFKSEMDSIGKVIKDFVTEYNTPSNYWSDAKKNKLSEDLGVIGNALVSRVNREEETLYPLYRE